MLACKCLDVATVWRMQACRPLVPVFAWPDLGYGLKRREPLQFETALVNEMSKVRCQQRVSCLARGKRNELLFQRRALQSPDLGPGNEIAPHQTGSGAARAHIEIDRIEKPPVRRVV